MLSPLQEQVARIVAGLEEAEGFALAGGAALIARGEVHRQTRDLDFFGPTTDAVDRLVPALDRALRDAGLVVHHVQENPGFARLIVESGDDRTELDLGADARLFPVEPGEPAPMLSGEELAVDKVLALFGRAEARDFVDLMAVEPRYGLDRLCDLAVEKDRGFDLGVFAGMLARFDRLRRDEFDLDDAHYERLRSRSAQWRARVVELARLQERGRDLGERRGPDLGREL
ncbi:MAG: nucleotidyl transferase AbiEii/AbiGii toxin family protein [Gaiellaceae bacterium]